MSAFDGFEGGEGVMTVGQARGDADAVDAVARTCRYRQGRKEEG